MAVLYVQTTGTQTVGFGFNPVPIPGLTLTLPEGAGEQALVILNVPNPVASTSAAQTGGGWIGMSVNGVMSPSVATFTFYPPSMGGQQFPTMQVPMTLVVAIPLTLQPQKIVAMWRAYGSSLSTTSPASLSATIA